MKTASRVGMWILRHPRVVSALLFVGLAVAALAVMPALGIAPRRPRG